MAVAPHGLPPFASQVLSPPLSTQALHWLERDAAHVDAGVALSVGGARPAPVSGVRGQASAHPAGIRANVALRLHRVRSARRPRAARLARTEPRIVHAQVARLVDARRAAPS